MLAVDWQRYPSRKHPKSVRWLEGSYMHRSPTGHSKQDRSSNRGGWSGGQPRLEAVLLKYPGHTSDIASRLYMVSHTVPS